MLLCVSLMRPVLSASLLLPCCPLKQRRLGATTLSQFSLSPKPSSGLLSCLCVTRLCLGPFCTCLKSSDGSRPDTDTLAFVPCERNDLDSDPSAGEDNWKADGDLTSLAERVRTNAELRREEETVSRAASEESKLHHRFP